MTGHRAHRGVHQSYRPELQPYEQSKSRSILIVDDMPEVRGTYEYLFKRAGWRVYVAADGKEAISITQGHSVDAILLDIFMPNMDGIEVLLRTRSKLPNTAIISVSAGAWHWNKMLDAALKFGADGAVSKDQPIPVLLDTVEACVARRQSHRAA